MARKYTCLLTKESAVFLLFALCSASVVHGAGKVLVLVDNINTQDTHSIFLNSLKGIKFSSLVFVHFVAMFTCCYCCIFYRELHVCILLLD